MIWLFIVYFIDTTIADITMVLEDNLTNYFNSDLVKDGDIIWQKHVIAYQNTLSVAMQESFGSKGMNTYIKRPANPFHVSTGYYHTDNQVHIVLQNLNLGDYPRIWDPKISFPLTANVIKVEARVRKMFVHTDYAVFRNTSNIVYDVNDQNAYQTSPFLFEQVLNMGQLAITAEGCKLSGIGITTLSGRTVALGNTKFRLLHCNFDFEIFTPGVASPPVIADYLPSSEGLSLERLIMSTLEAELVPKLQGALETYINTSAIFLEKLPELRLEQERIFEQITNYMNNVVRNLNVLTISRDMGKVMMEDFIIYWNETFGEAPAASSVKLYNMVLTGLETVYSSHTGGPFKLATLKVSEELRFATLQVRGSIQFQVGDETRGMYDFAAEINDVEVEIAYNIRDDETNNQANFLNNVEVTGWRSLQFSSPGMNLSCGEALITGYLLTKIPIYLTDHINTILGDAIKEANQEYHNFGNKKADLSGPNDSNAGNVDNDQDNTGNGQLAYDDNENYVANEPIANRNGEPGGNFDNEQGINANYGQGDIQETYIANEPIANGDGEPRSNLDYVQGVNVNDGQDNVQEGNMNNEPATENQYPPNQSKMLRRKKNLRMRRQKHRRSQKNIKKKIFKKATRTSKSFRRIMNEIRSNTKH